MSRLIGRLRPARYIGQHRPGVERLSTPTDPWRVGEALDPLIDTHVFPAVA